MPVRGLRSALCIMFLYHYDTCCLSSLFTTVSIFHVPLVLLARLLTANTTYTLHSFCTGLLHSTHQSSAFYFLGSSVFCVSSCCIILAPNLNSNCQESHQSGMSTLATHALSPAPAVFVNRRPLVIPAVAHSVSIIQLNICLLYT